MSNTQGGNMTLALDQEITVNGNPANGLEVDLNNLTITPTYQGQPTGGSVTLKPQANTVEYIILFRDGNGQETSATNVRATF